MDETTRLGTWAAIGDLIEQGQAQIVYESLLAQNVTVSGVSASVSVSAASGTPTGSKAWVTGAVASVTVSAAAGTFSTGLVVTGETATVTVDADAGAATVRVLGVPGGALVDSEPGTPVLVVDGVEMTVAYDSPAGYEAAPVYMLSPPTWHVQMPIGSVEALVITYPAPAPGATIDLTTDPMSVDAVVYPGSMRVENYLNPSLSLVSPPAVIPSPSFAVPPSSWYTEYSAYAGGFGGGTMGTPVPSPITASLCGWDGLGAGTPLEFSAGRTWTDAVNDCGSGTLKVPTVDPIVSALTRDKVVKFSYENGQRFAFVIENRETDVVSDAGSTWRTVSGRGLLCWLEDAMVMPYNPADPVNPLEPHSPDVRGFTYGSRDVYSHRLVGPDGRDVTWQTPMAVKQKDDPHRFDTANPDDKFPKEWPDPDACWIWATDPTVDVEADVVNWFRTTFTASEAISRVLYVTADNGYIVWVDGQQVGSAGYAEGGGYTWQSSQQIDLDLDAGDHVIAIRGQNLKKVRGGSNPAGVLATLMSIKDGKPDLVSLHTDNTWKVTTQSPAWLAGEVFHTLFTEAVVRGVDRVARLTPSFTKDTGSNGQPWTIRLSRTWPVMTPLLEVAQALIELGLHIWVDPDLTLHCSEKRGRSSVVLEYGVNLQGLTASEEYRGGTKAIAKTQSGWSVLVDPRASAAIPYMKEIGLSLENTDSETEAMNVVHNLTSKMTLSSSRLSPAAVIPVDGSKPYVDCNPGDKVTAPGADGAPISLKVLALTVTEEEASGIVTWVPELDICNDEVTYYVSEEDEIENPDTPGTDTPAFHPAVQVPPIDGGPGSGGSAQQAGYSGMSSNTTPSPATGGPAGGAGGGGSAGGTGRPATHTQRINAERIKIGGTAPPLQAGYQLWVDLEDEEGGGDPS